jgi:hypothetical protein
MPDQRHCLSARALSGPVSTRHTARFTRRVVSLGWLLLGIAATACAPHAAAAGWTLTESDGQPGKVVDAKLDGRVIARLVHGDGQFKPYLHVFGEDGELLTNGGLGADGKPAGLFPHHRGIFIGWKVISDLGADDCWHMTRGARMELVKLEKLAATPAAATITARIEWRGGKQDAAGSDLLLTETRTLTIARRAGRLTQVDARSVLAPARDLELDGDLQHSGVHFRAANDVNARKADTAYLWEPDLPGPGGKVASREMKWCRLLFPLKDRWYEALQLNAPGNPVDEVSWRDYGRFGFFFQKKLKAGQTLELNHRFLIRAVEAPAAKPKQSAEQIAASRAWCAAAYDEYAKAWRK